MKKNLTLILCLFMVLGFSLSVNAQCYNYQPGSFANGLGGPFTDLNPIVCGTTCGTAVPTGFEIYVGEGYILSGLISGSEYEITLSANCDATNNIITVGALNADGTTADPLSPEIFATGCSLTWVVPADGDYIIVIQTTANCGNAPIAVDNGTIMMDCGPNGAECATAGPCEAGTYTGPNPMNVCDGFPGSVNVDGNIAADGDFGIGFSNVNTTGTGGTQGPIVLTNIVAADLPYSMDAGLQGVLAAQTTPLPNLDGEWEAKVYAFDLEGEICDSTDIFIINFINDATDPICQALDIDELAAVTNWSISPNPSNGPVVISLDLDATYNVTVQIYDVAGKLIGSKFSDDVKSINYEFDLSNQPNGVYLARIGVDGNFSTEKIMINK